MKRYVADYSQYNDEGASDPANGHYYIVIKDTEDEDFDGYLFTSHPEETAKNIGVNYLALCKKYPSAYREHKKYSCVFIRNKEDVEKMVEELNNSILV